MIAPPFASSWKKLGSSCPAPFVVLAAILPVVTAAALPPVPVPAANPITEPKRVLGKILFWDEQLSSDNTVACGTCHRPASGGADPRAGRHPGRDPGTVDDVLGSPGIASLDALGQPLDDPLFGRAPRVTGRTSPSNFGALWAEELFWDGRVGGRFMDPSTGAVLIDRHGALEGQVVATLMNDAEMAKAGRTWKELTTKLGRVEPLALATDLPADVAAALRSHDGYPSLFAHAFGDPAITPARIAFAIATYERTLVADRTPWDRYRAGDADAMSESEIYGWEAFQSLRCANCHTPPLFTNNDFFNIGVRPAEYDLGRGAVTGDPEDAGDMKVPSLRNVGLRKRFMHTGQFAHLGAAIGFYVAGTPFPERDDIPGAGTYTFNMSSITERDILAFLENALTDPRVRDERFPFDRPRLRSERHPDDTAPPERPSELTAAITAGGVRLRWREPADDTGVVDYVLERDGRVIALPTRSSYIDPEGAPGARYRLTARDAAANRSPPAVAEVH
ncbi:MAG TPA: cytochrome c peroxidase [Gammaproteobacteria bacterium]